MGENKALEYKLAATSSKEARLSLFTAVQCLLAATPTEHYWLAALSLYLLSQAGRLSEGLTSRVPHCCGHQKRP